MGREFLDVPSGGQLGVTHGFSDVGRSSASEVQSVELRDVTLREGNQATDIALSIADKVELAAALDDAGVPIVQIGFAGTHEGALKRIAAVRRRALLSMIWLVFREGWLDHARAAIESGADELIVTQRVSARQLDALGMSEEEVLRRLAKAAEFARELGARRVALQPAYMIGARPEFLRRLLSAARDMGFDSVDVIDSTGIASPELIQHLVELVREHAGCTVGTHLHNDLGLATANNIAAIQAGARMADVSLLGVGERAGNAPLQQLVVALAHLYGIDTGVMPEKVSALCERFAALVGETIPKREPLVGRDVFAQKVEFHITSFLRDFSMHEPFSPELIGRRREIRLGAGSGVVAVAAKARELDLELPLDRRERLSDLVNAWAYLNRRSIPDEIFAELVRAEG